MLILLLKSLIWILLLLLMIIKIRSNLLILLLTISWKAIMIVILVFLILNFFKILMIIRRILSIVVFIWSFVSLEILDLSILDLHAISMRFVNLYFHGSFIWILMVLSWCRFYTKKNYLFFTVFLFETLIIYLLVRILGKLISLSHFNY